MQDIINHIEALIFSSPSPVTTQDITSVINLTLKTELTDSIVLDKILELKARYDDTIYSFELIESGSGWSFNSKPDYFKLIANMIDLNNKKKLSRSALETLSIIAFNPECTKHEIELIRGVNVDYAIDKLLEKELIMISGKREAPGSPIIYKVTNHFLDYFGLKSIHELPNLTDMQKGLETIE
jgi:segregation and condensation protein B